MFDIFANLSEVLGAVLLLAWAPLGLRTGRLARRPSGRSIRRGARSVLVHLAFAVLLLAVQGFAAVMLWRIDWSFASNRVVLAIPAVALPAVAVLAVSVPRLVALIRYAGGQPQATPSRGVRRAAADPWMVVPVQVTGVGAFCDFWVVFVDRPAPPYAGDAAGLAVTLLAAAGLLWWRQRTRQEAYAATPPRRPRIWVQGLRGLAGLAGVLIVLAGLFAYGTVSSRLPSRLGMNQLTTMDWGGGPVGPAPGSPHDGMGMSVVDLTGPRTGTPDVRFTLVAQRTAIRLSSGRRVDAWTFNGRSPGPELRMHQGDLVEVTVLNRLPGTAITVHWHGLDVPNAEDGVPGLTQNAIEPGGRYVYRFRAEQVGTYWYHSHQVASESVVRGLFGPLVVLPRRGEHPAPATDLTVMAHTWLTGRGRAEALGTADTLRHRRIAPGGTVRLRLINTSDNLTADADPRVLSLTGAPMRVTAIDGTHLHQPGVLTDPRLPMAIGGRYDVEFTMPDHPVRLTDELNPTAGLVLSPDGTGTPAPADPAGSLFDPTRYGTPAPTPFDGSSHFDRSFRLILDDGPGFFDGRFMFPPTINGKVFPHIPMLMVRRGDLVKVTFIDRGHMDHPMHLHGHHVLVLSRNGQPVSGSPWWSDTLEVRPGDVYVVAFRANNPGLWMDHCHNLKHASQGMVMHLGYAGITSPYATGRGTINHPR